ncbi:MAG TPA: hypothetical protein VD993_02955 [Chitinophagaceae bacterium]|nr:hypothetical protein [Chitinophagaceae bacterium]
MKIIVALTVIGFCLAACQRDNMETPDNPTAASRLSGGPWKHITTTLKYDDGTIDYGALDDCKKDDVYVFEAKGDVTVTHGAIPCSTDPADGKYATWMVTDNETKLKEVYTRDMLGEVAGTTVIYDILSLNDVQLVISRMVNEPGKTYQEINIYNRQ